jgi:hypothetical protein
MEIRRKKATGGLEIVLRWRLKGWHVVIHNAFFNLKNSYSVIDIDTNGGIF